MVSVGPEGPKIRKYELCRSPTEGPRGGYHTGGPLNDSRTWGEAGRQAFGLHGQKVVERGVFYSSVQCQKQSGQLAKNKPATCRDTE